MVESQSHNNPAPGLSPSSGSFVGRQRELEELTAALDDALSGQGRLVMLAGEPGIGKTRTAQELASYAETLGGQVLWGRCYEREGAPPYWPWVQSIRSHVHQSDPEQLRAEMGPGAANIAEIVSAVREKLPDLESPPTLEPEQARFRLFDSITTFLKNASQSQLIMLILDDLHWADRSSLLLLEFLVGEIQSSALLVLGTYRDVEVSRRHPLSVTLGSLIREQGFLRVQLLGLDQPEVEQFIQTASGVRPSLGLVETVHRRTEGNPLFVGEVIRMLGQEGIEGSQERITNIPEGVRDASGRRLDRLSEGCNQILTTASVIGREFDFSILRALSNDLAEESLLQLTDEALEAHMIEELPGGRERYQFSHALVQETLSEELSTSRKVRLHAQIGQALEELYGTNAEAHASELPHHFAEAELVLGTEKLVHYSQLAGERALAAYANEEALVHFQRALAAKGVSSEGIDPASDAETAALLFGLARAQMAMAHRHQMLKADSLSRAFDYYADVGDVKRAVEVAECQYTPVTGRSLGVARLIVRALELVSPESHQAGRLLARYEFLLGIEEGDYIGAMEAVAGALSIAEREHDTILEMETLANAARVDRFHLNLQGALQKSLRAVELARQHDDLFVEVAARFEVSLVYTDAGELEPARQHAVSMLEAAERLRDRFWLSSALNRNWVLCSFTGDWQAAREFSNRGLALAPADYRNLSARAVLEYQVGDFDQGSVHLNRLLEVRHRTPPGPSMPNVFPAMVITLIARITGLPDRLEVAEAAAQTVLTSPTVTPAVAQVAVSGLALLAVMRKDVAAAQQQYGGLQHGGNVASSVPISADRLLGLLAQTMHNLDQAMNHFEDAMAFCRGAGYRPELAWTCHDYADTLLQRDHPGDREQAMSLLQESLAISTELGMPPLMERVIALQERAESQPAKAPAYPDRLTQRGVEVLRLIAAGNTNQEIAGELIISVKTVGYHVGNILNKTTSSNRAEAATYAGQHGLV